ncbi:protein misato [Venturia canescens]|uniref:protein misato n=1 Tax=Venturia canescens TaxID=32260 RepID=UPI001C9BF924|nr:protein misato [Venturia canescens]
MATREILTLQLGHYSNYIGTHWWNLQESNFSYDPENPSEINNDVLYREGETARKQVTYTPRLLVVDLKGTLGYLNRQGNLYDERTTDEKPVPLWDESRTELQEEETPGKSSFLRSLEENENKTSTESSSLETEINSWVDYLVPRFHPRTINVVTEYKHECPDQPFDVFNYGVNLWQNEQFEDDFSDRIRSYVEECDMMQGFQVLLDSQDAFGGLGSSCVQHLRDEYGKSIIAFPSIDGKNEEPSAKDLIRVVNTALCWQQISENSSLFSPLCCGNKGWPNAGEARSFRNLNYDLQLKYHTSALLATALDTLSLRYRLKAHRISVLSDLCADLNKLGRKAVATSLSLPFPMTVKRDLIDVLDDLDAPTWTSLTPNCEIPIDKQMQSIALRGIPEERLKRPLEQAKKQMAMPAYRCSTVHEMMTMFLAYSCQASAIYFTNAQAPLKIADPFPRIFNNNVHANGDVAGWPVGEDVKSVPVLAGLHSGSSLSKMFESLHEQASRVKNIKRFHAFGDSGLEQDDYTECLNYLLDSKESFEDHYD